LASDKLKASFLAANRLCWEGELATGRFSIPLLFIGEAIWAALGTAREREAPPEGLLAILILIRFEFSFESASTFTSSRSRSAARPHL